MASDSSTAPSDSGRIANPLTAALAVRKDPEVMPSARRFVGVLPWSALAASLIVTLRILMVAHLNLSIALQLVTLTDTSKVLLGLAIIMFIPLLIFVALYVHLACIEILKDAIERARLKLPVDLPNRSLFFIFLWPFVAVLAFAFLASGSGLVALIGLILWSIQRLWIDTKSSGSPRSTPAVDKKPPFGFRIFLITSGLILMGVGFASICLNDTPWMPPERIILTNGSVVIGYVVAESNSEITILRNSDRSIITLPPTQVRSQVLCELAMSSGGKDLFVKLAWGRSPEVPLCLTSK
jgi:hypothetical protein